MVCEAVEFRCVRRYQVISLSKHCQGESHNVHTLNTFHLEIVFVEVLLVHFLLVATVLY
jgi:hypothetical protein